jgi:hypothetical protein
MTPSEKQKQLFWIGAIWTLIICLPFIFGLIAFILFKNSWFIFIGTVIFGILGFNTYRVYEANK